MISFEQAMKLIVENPIAIEVESRTCLDALGYFLADDVVAPIDLPPFDNAAVDGFAVNSSCTAKARPILGEVRAQSQNGIFLPDTMTLKIMTGAPLPEGADAVVMKEDVVVIDGVAHVQSAVVIKSNVRFRGEDIKRGVLVAKKGVRITPALIGVFHALGLSTVQVQKKPRLHIISTGDELVFSGRPLLFGEVYYLMGPMLAAQCREIFALDIFVECVHDDQSAILAALKRAINADLVLITGGMSKGDYDLVRPALKLSGVEEIFYQGAWRPGKPLYFGKRGHQRIFGLPGNPVATFVCFHVFVRPLMLGHNPAIKTGILTADFEKKTGFTIFARALVDEQNYLTIIPGQGSHQIVSLADANALVIAPDHKAVMKAGETLRYYEINSRH